MRFTLVSKSDQVYLAGKPMFLIGAHSRVQKKRYQGSIVDIKGAFNQSRLKISRKLSILNVKGSIDTCLANSG